MPRVREKLLANHPNSKIIWRELFCLLYDFIQFKIIFFYRNGKNGKAEANPFDEEEWDENDASESILVDNGEPGVPVKALYDYDGAESDELTFKQGIFIQKRTIKP